MDLFFLNALQLVTLYRSVSGGHWVVDTVYRPYGPMVCSEICEGLYGFTLSFREFYCRRVVTDTTNHSEHPVTETPFICLKTLTVEGSNSTPQAPDNKREWALCGPSYGGKSPGTKGTERTLSLFEACVKGNVCVVKHILTHGLMDINHRGHFDRTPVMLAARHGQVSVFDYLLYRGCDLTLVDRSNCNVLHLACKGGNMYIVRKLVFERKFDLESRGVKGWTPIMTSAYYGQIEVFDLLMSEGCNLRTLDADGNNILHISCLGGNAEMVRHVFGKNLFSKESKGAFGRTSLLFAAESGSQAVVSHLIDHGCNAGIVDKYGNTLLHAACYRGHFQLVKYLLTIGDVDKTRRNNNDHSPVDMAREKNHWAIVSLLSN